MSIETVRPRLPVLPYIVLVDLFLAHLIARKLPLSLRWVGFLIYGCVNLKAMSFTSGDERRDHSLGSAFATNIAIAAYLLLLKQPVNDFRHAQDTMPAEEMSLFRRTFWAFCLKFNTRSIGWNVQVANLPPLPIQKRWAFVGSSLIRAMRFFIFFDACQAYIDLNPLFPDTPSEAEFISVTDQGYPWQCLNIFAWAGSIYSVLAMQYALLAAVCVALGLSNAKYWPNMFGKWRDSYTIRRFWGRTWHQTMRRFLVSIGKFCSHSIGCPEGSLGSSYTQLYVAFIISGAIHACGDYMNHPKYFGVSFNFFVLQAMAITFEDAVIGLTKMAGYKEVNRWTRFVGYVWVFWWFSVSAPYFVDWSIAPGLVPLHLFPFSLTKSIISVVEKTFHIDVTSLFP